MTGEGKGGGVRGDKMAEQDSEKTEQATPKREQEAREKGQTARSSEIPAVAVLLMGTIVLYYIFPRIYSNFLDMTTGILSISGTMELTKENIYPFGINIIKRVFFILSPFLFMVVAVGVASNVLQIGFMFSPKAMEVKLSRINPIGGLSRIFSLNIFAELVKSFLKLIVVGYISYLLIKREFYNFPVLIETNVQYIMSYSGMLVIRLFTWTGTVLVILAAIDFGFKKWQHVKSMKMTKEEIKEEFKQSEGDQNVKSRIRTLQIQMARKRMMASVPKADVVITNPTHIAVAIEYKRENMGAPKVIAKGAGLIAERIKEIARANGVVVVENKPLARTLFKVVEIGGEIPANLYKAVAEILAYVYRLKRKV